MWKRELFLKLGKLHFCQFSEVKKTNYKISKWEPECIWEASPTDAENQI